MLDAFGVEISKGKGGAKEVRQFVRALKKAGFTASPTKSGHLKITHSQKEGFVIIPSTPSDGRSLKNSQAQIRRTFGKSSPFPAGQWNKPLEIFRANGTLKMQRTPKRPEAKPLPLRQAQGSRSDLNRLRRVGIGVPSPGKAGDYRIRSQFDTRGPA